MEQIQTIYAHRYVLQMVGYRFVAAAVQYGVCLLMIILGIIAGVIIAIGVVLVFWSAIDWAMQTLFSTGFLS